MQRGRGRGKKTGVLEIALVAGGVAAVYFFFRSAKSAGPAAMAAQRFSATPPPASPVVTKGYFAGSPRPLYHTHN